MLRYTYQKLLPSTAKPKGLSRLSSVANGISSPPPTRSLNPTACERCRRKKTKCEGQRPSCDRCVRNGATCQYDADVGESRSSALKRRYYEIEREAIALRKECHQLKRLYGYICASFEDEAYRVFKHIRRSNNSNPIDTMRSFDQDEFYKQECTRLRRPTEVSDDSGGEDAPGFLFLAQALPWSMVASDVVVSELISQYFTYDYLYVYPPVPRLPFLNEMRLGDPIIARCCSPLLVNAICAQQCFLSPKEYLDGVSREELAGAFLQEANRLLQDEVGRTSLVTSQATCLIYAAVTARD